MAYNFLWDKKKIKLGAIRGTGSDMRVQLVFFITTSEEKTRAKDWKKKYAITVPVRILRSLSRTIERVAERKK